MRPLLMTLLLLVARLADAEPPVFPLPPLTPAQAGRIDAVIASFPDSGDRAHVFFLGFAGYGGQWVFAEEIKLAAREVGERLGSAPRTLLLINDQRDADAFPMASHENLRYALGALGRVMVPGRDVLFLALSSHGGRNGLIEVSNFNLQPSGLGGRRLAQWLDDAGIRQRVVVVSACYSGAFLEPLAGNNSIIITAARHDRASFGCSDRRGLTYFGEAFYRDSLPFMSTLRLAYQHTSTLIQRREQETGARRSQPQAYFGLFLEDRLTALMSPAREFVE